MGGDNEETLLSTPLPWEDLTPSDTVSAAAAAAAARSERAHCLATKPARPPAVDPERGTDRLVALGELDGLEPGKHCALRSVLSGEVDSAGSVTKKLLFLYVRAGSGRVWECIAKLGDGLLCTAEIAQLAAAVVDGPSGSGRAERCSLVGWPERNASGTVTLHIVRIELQSADGSLLLTLPALAPSAVVKAPARPIAGGIVLQSNSNGTAAPTDDTVSRNRFTSSGNRIRPANSNRFMVMAQWLVDTFGRDALVQNGGVLDVAGGAGGIAFELSCRRGIPCTVVDPRPVLCSKKQRVALTNTLNVTRLRRHASRFPSHQQPEPEPGPQVENELRARVVINRYPNSGAGDSSTGGGGERWALRIGLSGRRTKATTSCADVVSGNGAAADSDAGLFSKIATAYAWAEEMCEAVALPPPAPRSTVLPSQLMGYFDETFDAPGALSGHLWSECSVVIGLHSDGATEPLVKLALKHKKPFAVVPCCVFPNTNVHRRIPDPAATEASRKGGGLVRTYSQFVAWLQALAPDQIRRAILDFEGRNVVLYSTGCS